MKLRARILSALLAASLAWGTLTPAYAAAEPSPPSAAPAEAETAAPVLGSLTAALRLDYAQPLTALEARQVKVQLSSGGGSLGESYPEKRRRRPGRHRLAQISGAHGLLSAPGDLHPDLQRPGLSELLPAGGA